MHILENKFPPLIITLLFSFLMWGISLITPVISLSMATRVTLSVTIFIVGLFFCISGVVSFRRAKTTVNPLRPESVSSLVSSGVYQVSRNPMYVGFAFFLVSFMVYLSSPWALVGVLGFVFYMNRFQIEPEERVLEKIFNAEFIDYKSRVRRWL